jgi:hypothetical protein
VALVLTLRQGEDFFIAKERLVVESIVSETEFFVVRMLDGARFQVVDTRSTEIFKGVSLSAGARGQLDLARVAIEAPRAVRIMRGDNYRKENPDYRG